MQPMPTSARAGLFICVARCMLGQLGLPRSAADMLPIVTDIFIQWRKVRSFAAVQRHEGVSIDGGWRFVLALVLHQCSLQQGPSRLLAQISPQAAL